MHTRKGGRGLAAALGVAALLVVGAPVPARADCAVPVGYQATAAGSTVTVCGYLGQPLAQDVQTSLCPATGLLRRDTATGETVLLTSCGDPPDPAHPDARCFLDECVPPGTYQYGLLQPYTCEGQACGTYYYATVVTTAAASACVRTVDAPAAFTGAVPWGEGNLVCGYHAAGSSGCASGAAPGAGPVLALNALALAAGLWLLRRRAGGARRT